MRPIPIRVAATVENFDEAAYLRANPDVVAAIGPDGFANGLDHYERFGFNESRMLDLAPDLTDARASKAAKFRPFLRNDMSCVWRNGKADYLAEDLRMLAEADDTDAVSRHDYDPHVLGVVETFADGLVLDCGAGSRGSYFLNVVNFEIKDYLSTDVMGIAEQLPFLDATFDAVLCLSVLEHVKRPWVATAEIVRVLRPGGKLVYVVPFLQPLHGYPHHYFNMTAAGLASLFADGMQIDTHNVPHGCDPIAALSWIVKRWSAQLPAEARERFLSLPISTLTGEWPRLAEEDYCRLLPDDARFELAAGTYLMATKL